MLLNAGETNLSSFSFFIQSFLSFYIDNPPQKHVGEDSAFAAKTDVHNTFVDWLRIGQKRCDTILKQVFCCVLAIIRTSQ